MFVWRKGSYMSQNLAEMNQIRSYLLGELAENEQDALEERLLIEPELLEISLIIEGELVDEYVMGWLSESDRLKLEGGLLRGEQQQRKLHLSNLLRLKANESIFAEERSTDRLSRLKQLFGLHRSYFVLASSGPVM
jgi:hypothetical protein